MTKREREKRAAFVTFSDALAVYLQSIGWNAVVVGRPRIQQEPHAREFNFEFVVEFTGGKKNVPK